MPTGLGCFIERKRRERARIGRMRVIILPLLLLCVGASATTSFPSGTPQDLTTSSMLKCRGGGLFPGGDASNSKGGVSKGKANNKKTSPNNKRVTSKGAKGQVGRARVGVSSENRGLWMNMDLDVRRLTDSMGEVSVRQSGMIDAAITEFYHHHPDPD